MRSDQHTATQRDESQGAASTSILGKRLAVKLAAFALAALAVMSVVVPGAQAAGSVPVSLCRTADGQAITAPGLLFSADDPPGLSADIFADSCAQGGSIELSFGADAAHRGGLSWALFTPANRDDPATNFYDVRLWRSITSDKTSTGKSVTVSGSIQTGRSGADTGETCVYPLQESNPRDCNYGTESTPLSDANKLELPDGSQGTGRLSGAISCYASADFSACPAGSAPRVRLRVYRISLRAPDPTAPALTSGPAGALLTANATVKGAQTVTYSAGDTGHAGVWKGELLIDGQPAAAKVADDNAGLCRQLSDGSFASAAPCKPTVEGATVALETATVANGTHRVALRVSDAAGNPTVTPATTVTFANPAVNTARPVLSATGTGSLTAPKVGDTLASTLGSWTPEGVSLVRQWVRCDVQGNDCQEIAGFTAEKYKLTNDDAGRTVRLRVDGSNSVGSSSAQTDATPVIAGATNGGGGGVGPKDPGGDFDGDGTTNSVDPDDDNDGTPDSSDPAPFDAAIPARTGERFGPSPGTSPAPGNPQAQPALGGSGAEKLNGDNASRDAVLSAAFVKRRGSKGVSRYGQSATIRGKLTTKDGTPIRDAKLELIYSSGDQERDMGAARTRPDGSYLVKLPVNISSRRLVMRYRYDLARADVTAKQSLELIVRASLTLKVKRAAGKLIFRGQAGIPGTRKAGRLITLEYRVGARGWRPFVKARTSRTGRYVARFRPAVPLIGRVQFRAVLGSGALHEGAASKARGVRFSR